jgi:hypothetical protein
MFPSFLSKRSIARIGICTKFAIRTNDPCFLFGDLLELDWSQQLFNAKTMSPRSGGSFSDVLLFGLSSLN